MSDQNGSPKVMNRRSVLSTIGATGTGIVGIGMISGVTSARRADTQKVLPPPSGGDDPWKQFSYNIANATRWKRSLGSGLEHVEADPGGTHDFRLAGDFLVQMEDGDIPVNGSIADQEMRIENLTPNTLAVRTSSNARENAMSPKPPDEPDLADEFGAITGALSLAASIAGSATGGLALGAAGLANTLFGMVSDKGSGATKRWHSGYGHGAVKGGHHCNFTVNELGGSGTLKIHSEVFDGTASNSWRLEFDHGLTSVTQI